MAAHVNHIIRHAGLTLQIAGKDNGMEDPKEAGHWMEMLFEKLEPALDSLAGEGIWLSLDKLEIDIQVKGNRWQEEALEKVTARIVEAISLHASHTIKDTGFTTSTPAYHFAEIFLFYLQTGYLPWNTGAEIRAAWPENIKQLFSQKESWFAKKLLTVLKQDPRAEERLLLSIPLLVFVKWMMNQPESLEPSMQPLVKDIHQLLTLQKKSSALFFGKEVEAWLLSLMMENGHDRIVSETPVLFKMDSGPFNSFEKALKDLEPGSEIFLNLKKLLTSGHSRVLRPEKPTKPVTGKGSGQKPGPTRETDPSTFENNITHYPIKENTEAEKGIFIQNAGLVIVAPFLPMLFKNLELWHEGHWQNREQAVCLIHYLATGNAKMEEYELVLPKVLCGMDPGEVADPTDFLPEEKWIQEADGLLQSVIEYWSILKDTSVDGLRGSFLNREGKLQQKGNDWQLMVEQKPYDMLLQQLPWNISMLQLPWMPGILYTDWVY